MADSVKAVEGLLPANVNKIFESKHTIIKPITENEINDRYLSWVNDKEINKYLIVRHNKQSINSLVNYINALRKKPNCDLFAVFTKKGNLHIGNMTITNHNVHGQGTADFGIMIGEKNAFAMGLGAEVHIVVLEYLFSDPNVFRINAGAIADNIVACRTLDSLGYVREGARRKTQLLATGIRSDVNLYGLLRDEWYSSRKRMKNIIDSIIIRDL